MGKIKNQQNILALWTGGLYKIQAFQDKTEGTYDLVGEKKNWLRGIQTCKISKDKAIVYYPDGIWELNLWNGQSKKINNNFFKNTRCCVAYKGKGISFNKDGCWVFDPETGKYEKLGKDTWIVAEDCCRVDNFAYIAHAWGIYEFNLDNGDSKLLKKNNWSGTRK